MVSFCPIYETLTHRRTDVEQDDDFNVEFTKLLDICLFMVRYECISATTSSWNISPKFECETVNVCTSTSLWFGDISKDRKQ